DDLFHLVLRNEIVLPSSWMGQSRMVSLLCKRTSSSRRSSTPLDSLQLPARRSHYEALGERDGCERRAGFQFHCYSIALSVQQLKDFPVGDHDDGPDALEMGLRLSIDLWNGRFQQPVSRLIA